METNHKRLIECLYLEMYDMLLAYARSAVDEESLAEEAVQETFLIACQKATELSHSPNPKGWLIKALKYTICNLKRSRAAAGRILSNYLTAQARESSFSEDKVPLEVLYENMADLEEFKLMKEFAVDGKSHLEMAKDRGISVSACKKRVQRAKALLQKKI